MDTRSPRFRVLADIVTSTHNHSDHLDAQTLCPILAVNPRLKLVIAEANRAVVADRLKMLVSPLVLTMEPL